MTVLKIISESYSFKEFANSSKINIYSCYDKGELRRKNIKSDCFIISFDVSSRDWDDINGQVYDSIEFLNKYGGKLKKLIKLSSASSAFIDFPLFCRIGKDIVNQNDRIPLELLKLCANIGLEIEWSLYDKEFMNTLKSKRKSKPKS